MTIKKRKYLKLIVDNTLTSTLKLLREKQKTFIKARLKLQKEKKFIDELVKKYGDVITETENKITNIERKINGNAKRTINKSKHARSNRN